MAGIKDLRSLLLSAAIACASVSPALAGTPTHTIVAVSADSITIGKQRYEKLKITPDTVIFIRGERAKVDALMVGMHVTFSATDGKLTRLDASPPR